MACSQLSSCGALLRRHLHQQDEEAVPGHAHAAQHRQAERGPERGAADHDAQHRGGPGPGRAPGPCAPPFLFVSFDSFQKKEIIKIYHFFPNISNQPSSHTLLRAKTLSAAGSCSGRQSEKQTVDARHMRVQAIHAQVFLSRMREPPHMREPLFLRAAWGHGWRARRHVADVGRADLGVEAVRVQGARPAPAGASGG